ncbi:zinc ribbon domain-containing protein [Leptolyngbya sp. 'hensonii']|uniref:zinc ribbon domain-containing protein n=1 Tax=Leptolyngbya sp. 'hensonii' TaxID=1922337 RepID=UPI00094F7F02|nr:zinc ribbon domain-containing protein [Leptolyngbya sp. 'hensonii']
MQCPVCGHPEIEAKGVDWSGNPRYCCRSCGEIFLVQVEMTDADLPPEPEPKPRKPFPSPWRSIPILPIIPYLQQLGQRSLPGLTEAGIALLLGSLLFGIIHWLAPPETFYDYYLRLAHSFLDGQLCLSENPSWLNELVPIPGKGYCVVYPIAPALFLLPLVKVFPTITQSEAAHLLFGLAALAIYLFFRKQQSSRFRSISLALIWSFATIFFPMSAVGSVWYIAQTMGATFVWLFLLCFQPRPGGFLFLSGLCLGIAAAARLPLNLLVLYGLVLLYRELAPRWSLLLRSTSIFFAGFLPLFLLQRLYNYARYQTFADRGYALIPGKFAEPEFQHGLFHPFNLPKHLRVLFLNLPKGVDHWPYLVPSHEGLSILITSPFLVVAFWWLIKSRRWPEVGAILTIMVIEMCHGTVGYSQFGYRFALDVYPLLFLALPPILELRSLRSWLLGLIGLSGLVNLWGLLAFRYRWFIW